MVQMNRLVGIDVDMRVEWTEANGRGGQAVAHNGVRVDDVVEVREANVQRNHLIG